MLCRERRYGNGHRRLQQGPAHQPGSCHRLSGARPGLRPAQRHDYAIRDYSAAIRIAPKDADAYCRRGAVYQRKGLLDKAIADYTEAIRLAPSWAAAYTSRASAYEKKGDHAKAQDDLSHAKKLEPKAKA